MHVIEIRVRTYKYRIWTARYSEWGIRLHSRLMFNSIPYRRKSTRCSRNLEKIQVKEQWIPWALRTRRQSSRFSTDFTLPTADRSKTRTRTMLTWGTRRQKVLCTYSMMLNRHTTLTRSLSVNIHQVSDSLLLSRHPSHRHFNSRTPPSVETPRVSTTKRWGPVP